MELDGTRVMVTGASTGIGRVTALRLARRGAMVWAAARDERRLEELAVQGFTDGLRREVGRRGVQVTLIAPGPNKTEFMARIRTGEPAAEPGALDYGLSPDAVAKAIMRALTRERVPGYRTITVPRIGGFSRIGSAPVVSHATDLAARRRARKALAGEE